MKRLLSLLVFVGMVCGQAWAQTATFTATKTRTPTPTITNTPTNTPTRTPTPSPTQVPLGQAAPSHSSAWHTGTLTIAPITTVVANTVVCTSADLNSIQVGDLLTLQPQYSTIGAGLAYVGVTIVATNRVSVCFANLTGSDVDDTTVSLVYVWYDRT